MAQKDPSKTEQATVKRRDKARNEGNVPRSQELSKLVVLLFGLIVVRLLIGHIADEVCALYAWFLKNGATLEVSRKTLIDLFQFIAWHLARILLPVFLTLAAGAYLVNRIQVGKLWTAKPLKPKFKQMLNPLKGVKKLILDKAALVRLARSLGSALAVGIGPYIVLKREAANLLPLFHQSAEGLAVYILNVTFQMILYALIPMLVIAIADTVYTRWEYNENLKMTKDEVKDERKQAEGDLKVKQQQKQKMLEVSQRRMLASVPQADVVVTNPTHFAVALVYDTLKAPAPMVVAKGADHMAKKIREAAREHGVPIRENKPLARALYDQTEVGDIIPEDLYRAVAVILAKLKKFKRARR